MSVSGPVPPDFPEKLQIYLHMSKFISTFAPAKVKINIFMVAALQQNPNVGLTPMQMHLVSMLNFNRSEAAEQRLKKALENFYLSEFERTKEAMFENGELSEEMISKGAATHFRTAY